MLGSYGLAGGDLNPVSLGEVIVGKRNLRNSPCADISQPTTQMVGKVGQDAGRGVNTNRDTNEGGLFAILADGERTSRELVIQHGSVLEDLRSLAATVRDTGNDLQVRHGRDFVGGSRERDLKTTQAASRRLGVGTDGRKSESDERKREHVDAQKYEGS